jgi:Arc/MetJ-type ribon-helix-helix transcriptional regulator
MSKSKRRYRKKQEITWMVRVAPELDRAVEELVKKDMHVSKSDLIRDAVRRFVEERMKNL